MEGRAVAPAAGTILNALATGTGAAFAIDLETTATVRFSIDNDITDERFESERVTAEIAEDPDADTRLIERCVVSTVEQYGSEVDIDADNYQAHVTTTSEIPMAAGLKSSSAAANATVLATLDALSVADDVDRLDACRIGVDAARETGVAVTGAFDDASASMLGGITVTDNKRDELLARDTFDEDIETLVYTPPSQAYSADADVGACQRIAPLADLVAELALDGRYREGMTVNGLAFCSALGFETAPMLEALPDVTGVSLSGTGPSYVAIGTGDELESVEDRWRQRSGTVRRADTQTTGAWCI